MESTQQVNTHKSLAGATYWFTGLSGAGKSTLSEALKAKLDTMTGDKSKVFILDGDIIRMGLNKGLGFSAEDRTENIRRISEVSKLFNMAGVIVFVAFISPYSKDRDFAKNLHAEAGLKFFECHISASLEVCEGRDVKGLYKKARAGDIPKFTGISDPYEAPANCDLNVDTGAQTLDQSAAFVINHMEEQAVIAKSSEPRLHKDATHESNCGATYWFTGLSGAGKSTLSESLKKKIDTVCKDNTKAFILDGDIIRMGLNKGLGFSAEDRAENIRRISEVSKLFNMAGVIVFVAFISPYSKDRDFAKSIHKASGLKFFECYISASLEVCEGRDVKGLYKKARAGDIPKFTGISDPYEAPAAYDLNVNTGAQSLEESTDFVMNHMISYNVMKQAGVTHKALSGATYWFTGLSGAGKSTLSESLKAHLDKSLGDNTKAFILDGDIIRTGLNKGLGFSAEDRTENIRRISEVSKLFNMAGVIVFVAFISPYSKDRDFAKNLHAEAGLKFFECHISASLEVCEGRDVKGLYKKARAGDIPKFTGISDPYEAPTHGDLDVNTGA